MATSLTATQQVNYTISPRNRKGGPAAVDGIPEWAVSDETVMSVVPAPDGMSALVVAVAPGTARVVVTADADLGAGVEPLIGTDDVTVTPGTATTLALSAGTPQEQP